MSCVEKRHMSHRMGSMLHHRFPNGFTDLFMDETDHEVSTLTDRAFRSLCVGDDAVYNDELLYGYSPFSCHKPLAGEPLKRTHRKESNKQGQNKNDKNFAQPWKQQHQKSISQMSSFLKALSATEETCEGMLIKNGSITESTGESWDKSALRSIQRELSEFSSNYHTSLKDDLPKGKSSRTKNRKSTVKLRKLNIKNFFLHSEFSPFQTWRDFNRFPFGQEGTVLHRDNIPKWCDMPFYKELTEARKKDTLHTKEVQSCQKVSVEPPPPTAPKPIPPSPPPKVLPKSLPTPDEKRCSLDGGDGSSVPWRRNRSRAKSVIPLNQTGIPTQEKSSKTVDENLSLVKKQDRLVEVKAVEEVSSLESTPFSICQLMTPLIPSRQPTETSEILQGVLSTSVLDLPLRPHSEAKLTPELSVKRENYKSLASSILFNLKDNRKRVKSRYSPPKFKTLEVPGAGNPSPQSDHLRHPQAGSEGSASGLSTPAIIKEGQNICSPISESNNTPTDGLTKHHTGGSLTDDYLLSNLLQTKWEAAANSGLGVQNPISPFIQSNNKKLNAKKQSYPSLNLYKKTSPVENDMKHLQDLLSSIALLHKDQPTESNKLSPLTLNEDISPKAQALNARLSPNTLYVNNRDRSPVISPSALLKEGLSSNLSAGKIPPNVPDNAKQPAKDIQDKYSGVQSVSCSEKYSNVKPRSTKDVIKAAREAINAAKSKALLATKSDSNSRPISDMEEPSEKEKEKKVDYSEEELSRKRNVFEPENLNIPKTNEATLTGKKDKLKKEPPPVPKKNFVKSDIPLPFDKEQTYNVDKLTNVDLTDIKLEFPPNDNKSAQRQGKLKHTFSARQNNHIKSLRYSVADEEHGEQFTEGDLKVTKGKETDEERRSFRESKDSEHIINDLHALKELERARLGDHVLDNAKNKSGVLNIDEEARVKNDLISRELRNIKKSMLFMRGNTQAKKELFASKEKERNKQDVFTKIDSNVIVNKTLINDNYDKAKMALEEIISERQKGKNKSTGPDAQPIIEENTSEEGCVIRVQQLKTSTAEDKNKQDGRTIPLKDNDLKERIGDLRDHNHMRQILAQTEPGLSETHISGGRMLLPGKELSTISKLKAKHVNDKLSDNPGYESEEADLKHTLRQISEESGNDLKKQNEDNKGDTPPVPPRSKKPGNRSDVKVIAEEDNFKTLSEEDIFDKEETHENGEMHFKELKSPGSEREVVDMELSTKESRINQSETCSEKEKWDMENKTNSKLFTAGESALPSRCRQTENRLLLEEFGQNKKKAKTLQADMGHTTEATFEHRNDREQETNKGKWKAPLKSDNLTNNFGAEEPDNIVRASREINVDAEAVPEIPRTITSPSLFINDINTNQIPPDQSSLSSKSSYFSVESTDIHRYTETEPNVYNSLENLIGEAEEVEKVTEATQNISQNMNSSDKAKVDYYSLSDHENESEVVNGLIKSPQKEKEVTYENNKEREDTSTDQALTPDENNQTPISPSNTISPPLVIPALFKVKDNTINSKMKKTVQPWSPRGSLSGSERGEEEKPEFLLDNDPATIACAPIPNELFRPNEISSNSPPPLLQTPSNLQGEYPKKPHFGDFLTVPQEEDRFSGISPSSEGVESITTSTVDTAEMGLNVGVVTESQLSKVHSEWSGSTCSGNESQPSQSKPPAVLPKSVKAVLKAMKLTNRRMKKEEAQRPQKLSQSSDKHRVDKQKNDKSEHKSSRARSSKSGEEKIENRHRHSEIHGINDDRNEKESYDKKSHTVENQLSTRTDMGYKPRKQRNDSADSIIPNSDTLSSGAMERRGRRGKRHARDKPEQRQYSSDRIISNVPVYKAQISEKPTLDRTFRRSQSIDRFLGDKVERRLSSDSSVNEKLDPRSQRIEKSLMEGLQQRGRSREKASKDNPLRRSHSIDAYSSEVPHPSTLSRQSSHISQLSRRCSIDHAIVTQSIPLTQRKLLQDPDSGQYFFVDMPVQVKSKTFFDPETGSYIQLPVQPPEAAVPQPLEVLTPPVVVYHSFVPVSLSPMDQKAPHLASEEFEERSLERSRQMRCKERHPYLEPVCVQHNHMLGEFLGTEELDCPS